MVFRPEIPNGNVSVRVNDRLKSGNPGSNVSKTNNCLPLGNLPHSPPPAKTALKMNNGTRSLTTKYQSCNQQRPITFIWMLESDSDHRGFYLLPRVPHGGQIESLWYRNYGRRGVRHSAEVSIVSQTFLGTVSKVTKESISAGSSFHCQPCGTLYAEEQSVKFDILFFLSFFFSNSLCMESNQNTQ